MAKDSAAKLNSPAPDFVLPDGDGNEWRLSDQRGKVVVLLFYPGDETPVCTKQMCSVRDRWDDYLATGAEVVGISSDSVESHRKFAEHHSLPLRLLSDSETQVADLYGARSIIPGRVARSVFVIDAAGILRYSDIRAIGIFRPKDEKTIEAIKAAQGATG
jgi:peroxiredoxin Q/BCP